jgi:hypothetical protein
MAEGNQEIGREFVKKTIEFIDGVFGFRVFMDSYTGEVSIPIGNNETINFDILMYQTFLNTENNPATMEKRYYYCECKKREDAIALRPQLKSFFINVLKATPHLPRGYTNCGFIFVHNKPFSITQANIHDAEFMRTFLENAYQPNEIVALCGRIGMICLDDWFLKLTASGRQQ